MFFKKWSLCGHALTGGSRTSKFNWILIYLALMIFVQLTVVLQGNLVTFLIKEVFGAHQ